MPVGQPMKIHLKKSVSNVLAIISLLLFINFLLTTLTKLKYYIGFGAQSFMVMLFSIACSFVLGLIAVIFNTKNIFSWIISTLSFFIMTGFLLIMAGFWDS